MKKLRIITQFIEYIFARLLVFFFSLIGWNTASHLGAKIGNFLTRIIKKRFNLSVDNIMKAFPDIGEKRARDIAVKSWENMGRTAGEFLRSASFTSAQIGEKVSIRDEGGLAGLLKTGKGAIVHLGHFGNWEITGFSFHLLNCKASAVTRRIRNPFIDKYLTETRKKFGLEIISHKQPFFTCVRNLKKGMIVGILMDQNMPAGEIFAPFLGRMASVTPLTALVALKTKTPIFPVKVERTDDKIVIVIERAIVPENPYSEQEVMRLIGKLNGKLEEWIRQQPEMWLWAHNRWKREKDALPKQN